MRKFYVGWKARLGLPLLCVADNKRSLLAQCHVEEQRQLQLQRDEESRHVPTKTRCWVHPDGPSVVLTDKGAEFVTVKLENGAQHHDALLRYLHTVPKELRVFERRRNIWWLHRSKRHGFACFLQDQQNYNVTRLA